MTRCIHGMKPEWCQDCRDEEESAYGCGLDDGVERSGAK